MEISNLSKCQSFPFPIHYLLNYYLCPKFHNSKPLGINKAHDLGLLSLCLAIYIHLFLYGYYELKGAGDTNDGNPDASQKRLKLVGIKNLWMIRVLFGKSSIRIRPSKRGQRLKLTSEVRLPLCQNYIKSIPRDIPSIPRNSEIGEIMKEGWSSHLWSDFDGNCIFVDGLGAI